MKQDYYPFGMLMPGRIYSSNTYRYGFNGKEKDDDVKGSGVQYDYGFRIYDTRLGKFLSLDPLTKDYASWTPYAFAMNRPIDGIDLDGLEWKSQHKWSDKITDKEHIKLLGADYVKGMTYAQAWKVLAPKLQEQRLAQGEKMDCADFTFSILCEFAYTFKLTINVEDYKRENRDPVFNNNNYSITLPDGSIKKYADGDWQSFATDLGFYYGSIDLNSGYSTLTVTKESQNFSDLEPGDLMTYKWSSSSGHAAIVTMVNTMKIPGANLTWSVRTIQGSDDDNKAVQIHSRTRSITEYKNSPVNRNDVLTQGGEFQDKSGGSSKGAYTFKRWNFEKFDQGMPKK